MNDWVDEFMDKYQTVRPEEFEDEFSKIDKLFDEDEFDEKFADDLDDDFKDDDEFDEFEEDELGEED